MTNFDFLNETIPEISQGIKEAIMVARGVNPTATYDGSKGIELSEADLYLRMTIMPEFKEGSLSIKYNVSSLKEAANEIYGKYDDPKFNSGEPTIRPIKL